MVPAQLVTAYECVYRVSSDVVTCFMTTSCCIGTCTLLKQELQHLGTPLLGIPRHHSLSDTHSSPSILTFHMNVNARCNQNTSIFHRTRVKKSSESLGIMGEQVNVWLVAVNEPAQSSGRAMRCTMMQQGNGCQAHAQHIHIASLRSD